MDMEGVEMEGVEMGEEVTLPVTHQVTTVNLMEDMEDNEDEAGSAPGGG